MTIRKLDPLLEHWLILANKINENPDLFSFEKKNGQWTIVADIDAVDDSTSPEDARELAKKYLNGDIHKFDVSKEYGKIKRKILENANKGKFKCINDCKFEENNKRLLSEGYVVDRAWISWEETSTN